MEKVILAEIEKLVKERNELRLQLDEARELIRRRRNDMYRYAMEIPECPYCRMVPPEGTYIGLGDEEHTTITCRHCNRKYKIRAFVNVNYDCTAAGDEE